MSNPLEGVDGTELLDLGCEAIHRQRLRFQQHRQSAKLVVAIPTDERGDRYLISTSHAVPLSVWWAKVLSVRAVLHCAVDITSYYRLPQFPGTAPLPHVKKVGLLKRHIAVFLTPTPTYRSPQHTSNQSLPTRMPPGRPLEMDHRRKEVSGREQLRPMQTLSVEISQTVINA